MALEAIIFDLDGTIIDTESADYLSWRELYAMRGQELPIDLWKQRVGKVITVGGAGFFDPEAHFVDLTGQRLDDEALRWQHARYMALCHAASVMPGVMDILNGAKTRGIKLGVASNSDNDWVYGWLESLNIRDYFACVRTRDDVPYGKPAPDMYLSAAACLGVGAAQCLAIEDSPTGMAAALAAGIRCVAVPNTMTVHLERPAVTVTLNSLAETSLDDLIALV
jgi:HAD superfamily hydrolase (TIGR01509 family)